MCTKYNLKWYNIFKFWINNVCILFWLPFDEKIPLLIKNIITMTKTQDTLSVSLTKILKFNIYQYLINLWLPWPLTGFTPYVTPTFPQKSLDSKNKIPVHHFWRPCTQKCTYDMGYSCLSVTTLGFTVRSHRWAHRNQWHYNDPSYRRHVVWGTCQVSISRPSVTAVVFTTITVWPLPNRQ